MNTSESKSKSTNNFLLAIILLSMMVFVISCKSSKDSAFSKTLDIPMGENSAQGSSDEVFDMVDEFPQFPGGVSYPYPNLFVSDDGNHIFWDEYQLGANLNFERQFNDIFIKACSPSNQYLSDLFKLYNFDTMNTILTYPSFGYYEFYNSDIHFADENTIFTNKTYDSNDGNQSYSYIFRLKIN